LQVANTLESEKQSLLLQSRSFEVEKDMLFRRVVEMQEREKQVQAVVESRLRSLSDLVNSLVVMKGHTNAHTTAHPAKKSSSSSSNKGENASIFNQIEAMEERVKSLIAIEQQQGSKQRKANNPTIDTSLMDMSQLTMNTQGHPHQSPHPASHPVNFNNMGNNVSMNHNNGVSPRASSTPTGSSPRAVNGSFFNAPPNTIAAINHGNMSFAHNNNNNNLNSSAVDHSNWSMFVPETETHNAHNKSDVHIQSHIPIHGTGDSHRPHDGIAHAHTTRTNPHVHEYNTVENNDTDNIATTSAKKKASSKKSSGSKVTPKKSSTNTTTARTSPPSTGKSVSKSTATTSKTSTSSSPAVKSSTTSSKALLSSSSSSKRGKDALLAAKSKR
jgi:hypothetical protein